MFTAGEGSHSHLDLHNMKKLLQHCTMLEVLNARASLSPRSMHYLVRNQGASAFIQLTWDHEWHQ